MLTVEQYVSSVNDSLAIEGINNQILEIASIIRETNKANKSTWVLGNGGSLAIAQHFVQDLIKMCGVRAYTINCPSVLTAYSNDEDFRYVFSSPLSILRDSSEPILIFSCSGGSRNYLEFISGFQDKPKIMAVVGTRGGFLKEKADICIHINNNDYQICETAFCIVADMLIKTLAEG